MEQDKKQKSELAEEQLKEVAGGVFTRAYRCNRNLKLCSTRRKASAQRREIGRCKRRNNSSASRKTDTPYIIADAILKFLMYSMFWELFIKRTTIALTLCSGYGHRQPLGITNTPSFRLYAISPPVSIRRNRDRVE